MRSLSKLLHRAPIAAVLLWAGCEFGTAPGVTSLYPVIAYVTPACDTVGRAGAHAVTSIGAPVTSFAVSPALPSGMSLDSSTGLISGTPAAAQAPRDYFVIATGQNGADTAVIHLWAVAAYDPSSAPRVAYDSPLIDTVGKAASHPAYSLAGPVTSYILLNSLPDGLTLNASSGVISGKPAAVQVPTDYRIVATGPGGKDTVTVRLSVVLSPVKQSASVRPSIAYDSPVYDTVGMRASHPALSFGGKVTSFAVISVDGSLDSLPSGLKLDTVTGLISGTPKMPPIYYAIKGAAALAPPSDAIDMIWPGPGGYTSVSYPYRIVATGPGGKDTADITIHTVWYQGGSPVGPGGQNASSVLLTVNGPSSSSIVLAKGSIISLRKMIVTLTSNVSNDSVIRDTILPGTFGFGESFASAKVEKTYGLKPLRDWNLVVKVLDGRDSLIYEGSGKAAKLLAGESRPLVIQTTTRYEPYRVRFTLPDSVGSSTGTLKQSIRFRRVRVTLDGVTILDSSLSSGYFAAAPTIHVLGYDYVRGNTHTWGVYFYGDLPGWDGSRPLFSGTQSTDPCPVCASGSNSVPASFQMTWTGPGSPGDPNYDPNGEHAVVNTLPTVYLEKYGSTIVNTPSPPVVLP